MENLLLEAGLGVALVAAIVEALKKAGMRTKWAPLVNLLVGGLFAVGVGMLNEYAVEAIIVLWASLSGVAALGYDGVRSAVSNISPETEIASLQRRIAMLKKSQGEG